MDSAIGDTDFDRAFKNPKNRCTVRLAQYVNDVTGIRLAREAYKYLQAEGVRVVQPIVSGNGDHIYLCADAQPKKDDLLVVCDWIKKLRGPSGRGSPFHDAYIDNIDNVLKNR